MPAPNLSTTPAAAPCGPAGASRLAWIDMLRGLCMLLILYFHSEAYFVPGLIIPYDVYVEDALAAFFVVSGYLFSARAERPLVQRLRAMATRLLLPYCLFTLLIALVRAAVTHSAPQFLRILTGEASWFVSTLMVAEVLFLLFQFLHLGSKITHFIVILLFVWHLAMPFPGILATVPLAMIFMLCGAWLRRFERILSRINTPVWLLLLAAWLALKAFVWHSGTQLIFYPPVVDSWPLFFVSTLLFSVIMVWLCRHIPPMKPLIFVGRHSLIYYFFCGAVPFMVVRVLHSAGICYDGRYLPVLLVFLLVVAGTTVVALLFSALRAALRSRQSQTEK